MTTRVDIVTVITVLFGVGTVITGTLQMFWS